MLLIVVAMFYVYISQYATLRLVYLEYPRAQASSHQGNDKWDITWYNTRERCTTTLFHAVENTVGSIINDTYEIITFSLGVVHDGKFGCNTVEYTTAFL